MPLQILTNTVWYDAARVFPAGGSITPTSELAGIENVTGGHNYYNWTASDTAGKYICYVNKTSDNLSCSHVVLTRADRHVGHQVSVRRFPTFNSSEVTVYDSGSNFNPTLMGVNLTTWVREVSISNQEGIALLLDNGADGPYTRTVDKLYFSQALTLSYPGPVRYTKLPLYSKVVINKQAYDVTERWQFSATSLSRSEVDTLENLPFLKTDPFFIYDADGTLIQYQVLHCVIDSLTVQARHDDLYDVALAVYGLKEWI